MPLLLFYLFMFYFDVYILLGIFLLELVCFQSITFCQSTGLWIEHHLQVQSFKVNIVTTQLLSLTCHFMYTLSVWNSTARVCFAHETHIYCMSHLYITMIFKGLEGCLLSCNIFAVSGENMIWQTCSILPRILLKQCCIWDISQPAKSKTIQTCQQQNHVV